MERVREKLTYYKEESFVRDYAYAGKNYVFVRLDLQFNNYVAYCYSRHLCAHSDSVTSFY
jgi:hypothetical protein